MRPFWVEFELINGMTMANEGFITNHCGYIEYAYYATITSSGQYGICNATRRFSQLRPATSVKIFRRLRMNELHLINLFNRMKIVAWQRNLRLDRNSIESIAKRHPLSNYKLKRDCFQQMQRLMADQVSKND